MSGLMENPLYVVYFCISGIPLGFIITWVYLVSDRSIPACMVFHLFVNFIQDLFNERMQNYEEKLTCIFCVYHAVLRSICFCRTFHVGCG